MVTPSPFVASLHVALGGAIGSVLRYQAGRWLTWWLGPQAVTLFPWATLAVNAAGCVLMGVLGGFTTFSAFSLELVLLMQRGQFTYAALYLILSVALGVTGLVFGLAVMRLAG